MLWALPDHRPQTVRHLCEIRLADEPASKGLFPTSPWVASGTSSSRSGLGPSLPRLWEATKHPAYAGEMEAPPLERKLVAILAADVAGYSRMMGIDEEGTLATLSAFRTVTDALIRSPGRGQLTLSLMQAVVPSSTVPAGYISYHT